MLASWTGSSGGGSYAVKLDCAFSRDANAHPLRFRRRLSVRRPIAELGNPIKQHGVN